MLEYATALKRSGSAPNAPTSPSWSIPTKRYHHLVDRRGALWWALTLTTGVVVGLASLALTVTQRAWTVIGVLLVLIAIGAVGVLIRSRSKPD